MKGGEIGGREVDPGTVQQYAGFGGGGALARGSFGREGHGLLLVFDAAVEETCRFLNRVVGGAFVAGRRECEIIPRLARRRR